MSPEGEPMAELSEGLDLSNIGTTREHDGPEIAHVWSSHGPQAVNDLSASGPSGPAVDLGLAAAPLPGHRLAGQAA
jgi:hypothetical protein